MMIDMWRFMMTMIETDDEYDEDNDCDYDFDLDGCDKYDDYDDN